MHSLFISILACLVKGIFNNLEDPLQSAANNGTAVKHHCGDAPFYRAANQGYEDVADLGASYKLQH